jgi:hypothetical protein
MVKTKKKKKKKKKMMMMTVLTLLMSEPTVLLSPVLSFPTYSALNMGNLKVSAVQTDVAH